MLDLTGAGVVQGQGQPASASTPAPSTGNAEAPAPQPAASAPQAVVPPPPASAPAGPETIDQLGPHRINLSLLGFLGRFRLTYEYMLGERHGVFAEALFSPNFIGGFDFISYGGALGYRFHWRGPGRGPFVGGVLALEGGNGGQDAVKFGDEDTYRYEGSAIHLTLAPHAGYRWQFARGFNITLRGGLGVAYAWLDPSPAAEAKAVQLLDGWTLGIDGEASLGWSF